MFQEGQKIGAYTLIRKIGKGGFGEVWLAERRSELVTTQVAIKFATGSHADIEMIRREAVVWAKASGHPNVLPIIEADIYDGHIVVVSEYAPDGSLEDLLQRQRRLPQKAAAEMALGILRGLEFLHSKQIIHRDIKPANILLQGNIPRLADFGISRVSENTSNSITIAGTPKYMAPEAFDGKRNEQTDIWAVGVMLYQMVSGQFPYPQEETTELIGAIVLREPQALPPGISPLLKIIIAKAMAKDASLRYRNAAEMGNDISRLLSGASGGLESLPAMQPRQTAPQHPAQQTPQVNSGPTAILPDSMQTSLKSQAGNPLPKILLAFGIATGFLLLLAGVGAAGAYYYLASGRGAIPAKTPLPAASPSSLPENENERLPQESPDGNIYDSADSIRAAFAAIEKEAGGKFKVTEFYIYSGSINSGYKLNSYMIATAQQPGNPDYFDKYIFRGDKIEKSPERVSSSSLKEMKGKAFDISEVNLEAIPGLVEAAKEKAKGIEGMQQPYVAIRKGWDIIKEKPQEITISVWISGSRKNVNLYANADGKIRELKID